MKINKNIYLVFAALFAVTFLVSGCTQQTTTSTTFVGGKDGLQTSFLTGNPPDSIYDGSNFVFAIIVRLNNAGESDIKSQDGYVSISGLDPASFGIPTFQKNFPSDLRGTQKNADGTKLGGDTATVEFGNLKYLPTIQGNIVSTVLADVCYKYSTRITSQICIKNDPQQLTDVKICNTDGETNPQNSGAPLQVTSLREYFAGQGKVGVTLTISHVGSGDAFFKDTETKCDDTLSNPEKDRILVTLKPVSIGGRQVTPQCLGLSDPVAQNKGYVLLARDSTNKASSQAITCIIDTSGTSSIFQVPVDAQLDYRYLQHIEVPITIKHLAK